VQSRQLVLEEKHGGSVSRAENTLELVVEATLCLS
jgi:hypothetical protein